MDGCSSKYENNVNPGLINPVYGCLIGRVPFKKKYQIMTIGGVTPLINKLWFINPGLTLHMYLPSGYD